MQKNSFSDFGHFDSNTKVSKKQLGAYFDITNPIVSS
jgi:hypothetical protein